jgi:sugar/nucleoside kinase (ribokinase family)
VNVVDTTGAGDAFYGGMIYSLIKGFSLKDAGIFANACGALCCTQVGARAMGKLKDVKKLMQREEL